MNNSCYPLCGSLYVSIKSCKYQQRTIRSRERCLPRNRTDSSARELRPLDVKSDVNGNVSLITGDLYKKKPGMMSKGWKIRFCTFSFSNFTLSWESEESSNSSRNLDVRGSKVTISDRRGASVITLQPANGDEAKELKAASDLDTHRWLAILQAAANSKPCTLNEMRMVRLPSSSVEVTSGEGAQPTTSLKTRRPSVYSSTAPFNSEAGGGGGGSVSFPGALLTEDGGFGSVHGTVKGQNRRRNQSGITGADKGNQSASIDPVRFGDLITLSSTLNHSGFEAFLCGDIATMRLGVQEQEVYLKVNTSVSGLPAIIFQSTAILSSPCFFFCS